MSASGIRRAGAALATSLLTLATAAFVGVAPAHAAGGAYLRLAHLSPDTPAVDVTVTAFDKPADAQTIKGVKYGDLSAYQNITPGTYTIAMRPAGADPKTPPVISATLNATTGRAYTVAGLGKFASLALRVLDDDIALPPAGRAKMRVVNAAPTAGQLTIHRGSDLVIDHAQFGQASPYSLVQAGSGKLTITPEGATDTTLPVTLAAGAVYTVLVLEHDSTLSAQVRLDAKGAQVVPNGPVETGFGGTASTGFPAGVVTLLALTVIAVAASIGVVRSARRG